MRLQILMPCVLVAMLVACSDGSEETPDPGASPATGAADAAADQAAAAFDAAYAKGNWSLAKAQGDVLNAEFPGSAAAERIAAQYEEAKSKATAARETSRLANLWSYSIEATKGGRQLASTIYSKARVDTDGTGAKPVQLVFRDRPAWGRSAYLVLQGGDFDCYSGCKLKVTLDGRSRTMEGWRPDTDEAIAMFIKNEMGLYKALNGVKELQVEFPVRKLGRKEAVFEVGGLDRARLPGWDQDN